MSKFFAIFAIIMVLMAGIFHMLFIMFDYAFHNPESGGLYLLSDKVNESIDNDFQYQTDNTSQMLTQMFGYGRIVCIVLVPIAFIIGAIKRRPEND